MASKPICFVCKSSEAQLGCRCNGEIVLLGECCALDHYKDTRRHHQSLSLYFALELLTDRNRELQYLDHSISCNDIQMQLIGYKASMSKFREEVKDFQGEAKVAIDKVSDDILCKLNSIDEDIQQQISKINTHLNTLDDAGYQVIKKFKGSGLEGLLKFCPSVFVIYQKEMLEAIKQVIHVGRAPGQGWNKGLKHLTKQLNNKISTISNLEKDLTKLKREVSELKLSLKNVKSEVEERKKLSENLEAQLASSKEQCERLAEEAQAYELKISSLTAENSSFKAQLDNNHFSLMQSDAMVAKLEVEIQHYQHVLGSDIKSGERAETQASSVIYPYEESIHSFRDFSHTPDITTDRGLDAELDALMTSDKDAEIRNLKMLLAVKNEESARMNKVLDKLRSESERFRQVSKEYYNLENMTLLSPALRQTHYSKYSNNRYIYKPGGIYLYQFDTYSKKTAVFNLASDVERSFNTTSTCLLKNGDVFIAGFFNPVSSDAYLFNVELLKCMKLPSMSIGRYGISLYYHKDNVYAFGGKDNSSMLSTAEKYNLNQKAWSFLPNMQHARCSAFSVGTETKIYIIAGGVRSIEVFDILKEEFVLAKLQLSSLLAVSWVHDEKVYILEDDSYKILGLDLSLIDERQNDWKQPNISINNTVLHNNNFIFFNYKSMNIEKFRISSEEDPLKPITQASNSFSFIPDHVYFPKPNTRILSRFDLHTKNLNKIDLSSQIDRNFNSTSTCLLSNGSLLITGFSSPITGDTYLFKPEDNSVIKLPSMMQPRCLVALICIGEYVYAFGGETESGMTRAAERLNIAKSAWEPLPDMNQDRSSSVCINVDDRIYLIAGGVTSIEEFSLISLNFTLTTKLVESMDVIGFMRGEEIYILEEKGIKVFDKNLNVVKKVQDAWNLSGYCINNCVVRQDCAVFYNVGISNIEKFFFDNLRRKIVIITK
jgi:hypothetical protein